MKPQKSPSLWDRLRAFISPPVLRLEKRSYDAASSGRRTEGWRRDFGDVNRTAKRAGRELRLHARDLIRNVGWARRAQRIVANNTVGWGLMGKPSEKVPAFDLAWKTWAESTVCDAEGRLNFVAFQKLLMRHVFADGEVLVRRRTRLSGDGLPLPFQLQMLEIDYLDATKDDEIGIAGGPIIQGVEFDQIGRRVAYWLYPQHPGSTGVVSLQSRRIPASEIHHAFATERAGQVRGVSWLAAAVVPLKDLDEYEDAELMKQKIAACFAAFVSDADGSSDPIAERNADAPGAETPEPGREFDETIEPGAVIDLPGGKEVTVANPPSVVDGAFTTRNLRRIAAAFGITYEDLTGDYSQVNFSSARLGRLVHQGNVEEWQQSILLPFCDWVWGRANDAADAAGLLPAPLSVSWTVPTLPMLDPVNEAKSAVLRVRGGIATPSQVVREQGMDPDAFWEEYAKDRDLLREKNIWLDSDVEKVSAAGLTQERPGSGGGDAPPTAGPAKPKAAK